MLWLLSCNLGQAVTPVRPLIQPADVSGTGGSTLLKPVVLFGKMAGADFAFQAHGVGQTIGVQRQEALSVWPAWKKTTVSSVWLTWKKTEASSVWLTGKRALLIRGMIAGSVTMVILIVLLLLLLQSRSKTIRQQKLLGELRLAKAAAEKQAMEKKMAYERQVSALEKETHAKEMALKNRELLAAAMQITTKNKILNDVYDIIQDADPDALKSRLEKKILNNLQTKKDWKEFMWHFRQVHPSFFIQIHEQYPGLTDHELRLAAFLKTNLSTKEMSQILHVTPGAISKSRQRLRKKLGIQPDESLYGFMNRFG